MTENRLTLAVQKKGRLAEGGLDLLKRAGVKLAYSRDDLLRRSENEPIDLMLIRDDDIPSFVASGACDYGIVGENVLYEAQNKSNRMADLEIALKLGFARCTLKLAAPKEGGITSAADICAASALWRATICCASVRNSEKRRSTAYVTPSDIVSRSS